jgi:hypothetical protein
MSPESISSFPGLELCHDVRPAAWVRPALTPWIGARLVDVSSFVPAAYPAHGRIFHRTVTASGDPIRWREIADQTGKTLDGRTRYSDLIGWYATNDHQTPPAPWGAPEEGTLERDECEAVGDVLSRFTTTPDSCWFGIWEGYGSDRLRALGTHAPRVRHDNRDYLLFHGPVTAATAFHVDERFQSPTMWWPDDRAWFVSTDLDDRSSYLGASPEAVQALIGQPDLEVLECEPDQAIDPSPWTRAP